MTHNPADRSSNPPTTTLVERLVEKSPVFEAASNAYVLTLRNPDGPQAAQAIQSLQDRVKAVEEERDKFRRLTLPEKLTPDIYERLEHLLHNAYYGDEVCSHEKFYASLHELLALSDKDLE